MQGLKLDIECKIHTEVFNQLNKYTGYARFYKWEEKEIVDAYDNMKSIYKAIVYELPNSRLHIIFAKIFIDSLVFDNDNTMYCDFRVDNYIIVVD